MDTQTTIDAMRELRDHLEGLAEAHIVLQSECPLAVDNDWFGASSHELAEPLRAAVGDRWCECATNPPMLIDDGAILQHCHDDAKAACAMMAAIVCHHMAHAAAGSQDHDARFIRLACHAAARLKLNQIETAAEWLLDWPRIAPSGPEAYRQLVAREVSRFIIMPLDWIARQPIPAELDAIHQSGSESTLTGEPR